MFRLLPIFYLIRLTDALYGCGGVLTQFLGIGGGYGSGYGGQCGMGSIFHHWVCCPYNPMDCCVQLETWFIVFLVIAGCCFFCCLIAAVGGCIWNYRRGD